MGGAVVEVGGVSADMDESSSDVAFLGSLALDCPGEVDITSRPSSAVAGDFLLESGTVSTRLLASSSFAP